MRGWPIGTASADGAPDGEQGREFPNIRDYKKRSGSLAYFEGCDERPTATVQTMKGRELMTKKKSTSKGSSASTRAVPPGDLAEMLSAVMSHPDMPHELYNLMGDWLNDSFHDGLRISEPWFIYRALCIDRARERGKS
jgi:hypothetical protein